jgi:hypothetical protein
MQSVQYIHTCIHTNKLTKYNHAYNTHTYIYIYTHTNYACPDENATATVLPEPLEPLKDTEAAVNITEINFDHKKKAAASKRKTPPARASKKPSAPHAVTPARVAAAKVPADQRAESVLKHGDVRQVAGHSLAGQNGARAGDMQGNRRGEDDAAQRSSKVQEGSYAYIIPEAHFPMGGQTAVQQRRAYAYMNKVGHGRSSVPKKGDPEVWSGPSWM